MKIISILTGLIFIASFTQCNQSGEKDKTGKAIRHKPSNISYHFEKTKTWVAAKNNTSYEKIIQAINRMDKKHLLLTDSIIIPNEINDTLDSYMPFPLYMPYLEQVKKIIYFSYPSQTFAAYENGILVYTGPTNMGRKADPTPTGLYFTNWKAEETTSTFNDEWDLRWNFNIENKLGIGWHQYDLPGYPASHSCLRLLEVDARYLYTWANQWKVDAKDKIISKGTPVIVFGNYSFDGSKPWLQLVTNPKALEITNDMLEKETSPYLATILGEQKK